jgi:steroid delta-isomerase-like uncharacterized protein
MAPEQNKALVCRWFREMDAGNLDALDTLVSDAYLDHNPPLPDLPPGREGVRQAIQILLSAFPDVTHTIHDQLAEGDKVMTRVTARATFTGEIFGVQPTGKTIEVSGIAVHRVADGKLVEHWAHMDMAGFMQQIEAPAQPAATR